MFFLNLGFLACVQLEDPAGGRYCSKMRDAGFGIGSELSQLAFRQQGCEIMGTNRLPIQQVLFTTSGVLCTTLYSIRTSYLPHNGVAVFDLMLPADTDGVLERNLLNSDRRERSLDGYY